MISPSSQFMECDKLFDRYTDHHNLNGYSVRETENNFILRELIHLSLNNKADSQFLDGGPPQEHFDPSIWIHYVTGA
jgi:hypothetical protein